jgi:Zn finger protein HypA/HybF involved in hydrogenase expression
MIKRKKSWTNEQFIDAVNNSFSLRQVIAKLGLQEAGGNYEQIKRYIKEFNLNTSHFRGKAWNKGMRGIGKPIYSLEKILVKNSRYQSYMLKIRLFKANLKAPKCALCDWSQKTSDGRLPLELDHINGDRHDNRLKNLRILCPNCHSLQSTHRGKNRSKGTKKIFI